MELRMRSTDAWLASVLLLCASSLCAAESARSGTPEDRLPICGVPFSEGTDSKRSFDFHLCSLGFPCRRFHFYHPTGRITT